MDAAKSGNNAAETIVSRGNVAGLARLFAVPLSDSADGAPVVAAGIATNQGPRDLAFATTKAGRIVALDARTGAILWSDQPATGPRFTTSSPAIDPGKRFVYGYGLDGRVHKYVIATGIEIVGGGWPQLVTLKPDVEKSASALAIAEIPGGRIFLYVASGGYPGDQGDYQGHVTAIDLASGSQAVFNANCSHMPLHFVENGSTDNDCSHVQSAVWARAGVVYERASNRIFFSTGNGDFDAHLGGHEWGDSVLALSPDGSGVNGGPLDSYTPTNFQSLENGDVDLGSSAPAILAGPPGSRYRALAVQAGKDGLLRLLALDDLSGQGGPGHIAGELQILSVPQGGGVLTALGGLDQSRRRRELDLRGQWIGNLGPDALRGLFRHSVALAAVDRAPRGRVSDHRQRRSLLRRQQSDPGARSDHGRASLERHADRTHPLGEPGSRQRDPLHHRRERDADRLLARRAAAAVGHGVAAISMLI